MWLSGDGSGAESSPRDSGSTKAAISSISRIRRLTVCASGMRDRRARRLAHVADVAGFDAVP